MPFQVSEVKDDSVSKKNKFSWIKSFFKNHTYFAVFFCFIMVLFVVFSLFGGLNNPTRALKQMVFAVGKDVMRDEMNHTNFLLLGIGGGDHDGAELTDSIIIASLDHDSHVVSMLSIPRDLYYKTKLTGGNRINSIYETAKNIKDSSPAALEFLKDELSESFGVDIHYYAKIDFNGFTQMIDALGGIDVDVKESIYDTLYPKEGTILYETFSIEKGMQHLDGATALKYVRSRKSTSDFDRSLRQQQVMMAAKNKALSLKTLTSPDKIKALLDSVSDNFETNLSAREIVYLASLAEDYDDKKIVSNLLHDDPSRAGGLLYTPMREFYNGMFVLLPEGNSFDLIKKYVDIVLFNSDVVAENISLQILNGTKVVGRAAKLRHELQRLGFRVVRFGNATNLDVPETLLYVRRKDLSEDIIKYFSNYFGAKVIKEVPAHYDEVPYQSGADLILEIGNDFKDTK